MRETADIRMAKPIARKAPKMGLGIHNFRIVFPSTLGWPDYACDVRFYLPLNRQAGTR